jgi:glucose-1-phosphate cytidylyltransferase
MKVVLFCGGFGMRLREYSESVPKPLVNIGYRPILWHIMKYYAHFGHKDFILCLGWKANAIKQYFLNYDECISNDFILSSGGSQIDLLNSDIQDWNITFVDTGISNNIGQRLKAVEELLIGEEIFLANYTDGLTDLHLPALIEFHRKKEVTASFLSVKPRFNSFHAVKVDPKGYVNTIDPIENMNIWMNGGFFVFTPDIFKFIREGEELVEEPFHRLAKCSQLGTYQYNGFWSCMDTFKEKETLEDMYTQGHSPWEVWSLKKESKHITNGTHIRNGSNGIKHKNQHLNGRRNREKNILC